ncbi:MAG TPA: thioredoxin family protein [Burkholderiales bacterium]|nr:thioredoxin family protein [Burkholderiales bacterium]
MRSMLRWLIALSIVMALAPLTTTAAETPDAASFFNLNMGDLKTELAEARTDGKKALMVMFEQEGCPGCLYMKRNILNRRDVQDFYRSNFANLSLDIWSSVPVKDFANREQTEKAYAQAAKIKGTPTFVFYDLSGNEIARVFGTVDTPDEFLLLGQFVASGAYKTRTFAQYKTEPRAMR